FFAAVLYTVLTTPEYPPDNLEELRAESKRSWGSALSSWFQETRECYVHMPGAMKRLAVIQFFTWMGLFCMWIYYSVAVPHNIFGATDPHAPRYDEGVRFAARTTMVRGAATPLFALCIPFLVKKLGRTSTHALALALCGLGLLSVGFIHTASFLYL